MNDELLQPTSLDQPAPVDPIASSRRKPPVIGFVIILLLLVLMGIWFLSQKQAQQIELKPTPTPVPSPTATPDPRLQADAEAAKAEVLALMGPLRAATPQYWAAEAWTKIEAEASEATGLMAQQDYQEATALYLQNLKPALENLTQRLPRLPETLMPQAMEAYGKGDKETAVNLLQIILYVDPAHAQAKALLPRAEVADKSFSLLKTATQHSENAEWGLAWQDLNNLATVDALFPGAAELKAQVEKELFEVQLQDLLSQAVAAIDQQDFNSAQALLERAAQFAPDHPAVLQLQKQVSDTLIQQQVLALKEQALEFEGAEKWTHAHKTWLEMKSLDASAPWIETGLQQSLNWKIIDEKLTRALQNPAHEQSGVWVEEFKQREDWPTALAAKADLLEKKHLLAISPVDVTLISDFETEVQISKVGRWKPFQSKVIQLKPGSYFAKGIRLGYRDVRLPITVNPGQEGLVIEVICKEGI